MPDDVKIQGLYEHDFYAWAGKQAEAIRAAHAALADRSVNDWRASLSDLDWKNLAEEIETLGRGERRELARRIATVIEHLIKLEFSPAAEPRAGWQDTVDRSRAEIAAILRDSPSLRHLVPDLVLGETENAGRLASRSLTRHGETTRTATVRFQDPRYTPDQVLGDWWPDAAAAGRQPG